MNIPKILFVFLLIGNTILAQSEAFTYDMEGLHPNYIVVEMEGISQSSLYKKALAWSKTDNRTVISLEEGKKVVFQGEKENAMCFILMGKKSCNALRYQVEVAFKEGKYKFDVLSLEQYGPINDTGKKGWFPFELDKAPDAFYTRGGDLKKEYSETPQNISDLFNSLNEAFKKGLAKSSEDEEDDGW
jgi:hypothetical protein